MEDITVKPLPGKTFGAIITGVKLPSLGDAAFAQVHAAFLKYSVLIFPGQFLTNQQNTEFGKRFGDLEFGALPMTNQDKNGKVISLNSQQMRTNVGNETWHSDSSYRPIASKCGMLSAVTVPSHGGQTGFADMRAAYEALDQEIKDKIEGLSAYHSTIYSQANDIGNFPDFGDNSINHPVSTVYHEDAYLRSLVKIHPDTGVRSLFAGRHAFGIPGLSRKESRQLLADINKFAVSDASRVYHHDWEVGDTIVWDNRCLLHRACPYDYSEPRVLTGTRVAGLESSELAYYPDSPESEFGRKALAKELGLLRSEWGVQPNSKL